MGTRSTVHFIDPKWDERFIVYVSNDGYPAHRGFQLLEFLRVCNEDIKSSRLTDAGRTAARFVGYMLDHYHQDALNGAWTDPHPLGTINVKLCAEDPPDIEYRYTVDCSNLDEDGIPATTIEGVGMALLNLTGENRYQDALLLRDVLAKIEKEETS